jgi:hypothetical protein
MPRHIHFDPHVADNELHDHYRRSANPVERSHWAIMGTSSGCQLAA